MGDRTVILVDMVLMRLGLIRFKHYQAAVHLYAHMETYLIDLMNRTPHENIKQEIRDVLYQSTDPEL